MASRCFPDSWVLDRHSLFGLESECQLTFFGANGRRLPREECAGQLVREAACQTENLPGRDEHDLFLSNGARFYRDSGVGLCNLEYATPECTTPDELVAHIRAGDAIMADALGAFIANNDFVESALVSKCNFDYHGHTSGSHENHLHTMSPSELAPQLIPLLASRVIVSGGGGFDDAVPGLDFMCSPRVGHLEYVISPGAQDSRAIFTVKNENLSGPGYYRLQLLSSEGVRCELSERMRFAQVGIVLRMAAADLRPGGAMDLADPLRAINDFARDPTGTATAELASGRRVTALDIQRHYLDLAESRLSESWMPAWAETECKRWRWVLDALADDPQRLIGHLDWPTKQYLYRTYCEKFGIAWESLPRWSKALGELHPWRRAKSEPKPGAARSTPRIEKLLTKRGASRTRIANTLKRQDLDPMDLPRFIALRDQLFEADIRFGEIRPDGLFACLEREGLIATGAIGASEVEHARREAPPDTRAGLRGASIRDLQPNNASRIREPAQDGNPLGAGRARSRLARNGRRTAICDGFAANWDRIVDRERNLKLLFDEPFQTERVSWVRTSFSEQWPSVSLARALMSISEEFESRRPRQALARIRELISGVDSLPPFAFQFCLLRISRVVPNYPVPALRRGGATAGPVLTALFESESLRSDEDMWEQAGQLLYRFHEAEGRYECAARVLERMLAAARERGDERDIAVFTNNLGYEYLLAHHWPSAEYLFEQALARFRRLDMRSDVLNTRANILECRFSRLSSEQWQSMLPELKSVNRALVAQGDWRARKTLGLLARYAQHRGRLRAARGWMRRAVAAASSKPTQLRDWDKAYLEKLKKEAGLQEPPFAQAGFSLD
jgi:proteasome accessory factor A